MDLFLNQLIKFYSTNLQHLTTHSTTCWPTKWRSHCDHRYVTSLHPMYNACAPYSAGWHFWNISTQFHTLVIRWHPPKILQRSSRGTPPLGLG